MKILRNFGLAAAVGVASFSVNASTLVYDFSGALSVTIDPTNQSQEVINEYSEKFTEAASFKKFAGQLILPSFENYLTGTHTIGLNTGGLQLSIVSGLLGGLEGTKSWVTNGSGALIGSTFVPDASQAADYGTLSIVNGNVAGFSWFAGPTSAIVEGYNTHVAEYFNYPTKLGDVSVTLNGATSSLHIGDVYFAANASGSANATFVSPISPVPEAGSFAMLMSGLGIVGAIVRRRRIPRSALA